MAEEREEVGEGQTVKEEMVDGYGRDGEGGEEAVEGKERRHLSGWWGWG